MVQKTVNLGASSLLASVLKLSTQTQRLTRGTIVLTVYSRNEITFALHHFTSDLESLQTLKLILIHQIYSSVTSFEHSGSVGIMVGLLWVWLLWLVSMNCCLGRIQSLMVLPTCPSAAGPMWQNGTLFNSTVRNRNVLNRKLLHLYK